MLRLENGKKEYKKFIEEFGERKKRNFFTKLEEASKKRKRISGENVEFVESQEHEKKYCTRITPGMDATLTANLENLSDQGVYQMKRNGEQIRMRTENVQLGEEKKLQTGKFKQIQDSFENNCNKADMNVLLPTAIELLRADSANRNQSSKEENLASVQQGAGRREPAIGGDFSDVEPSSNEKFRK